MKSYMVKVEDLDGATSTTVCETERDLVNLINNVDKSQYEIRSVEAIQDYVGIYTEFCMKNANLETGNVIK